ncbi:ribonuclease H-like domain-containing protein [Hygrophoropsis aurantiaca]|uniref:Ribonuclease H-like domain-containing protein n=1 Tax=Hygrophoropsis aurantiaca TaxID=72124 RepID=A0ACB8ALA5_9AGAM|nr:ribonuclease H-like domain-containing protein [Hygrophoropsis aurantiaca]
MPPKNACWEHFYSDGKKYKGNQTHVNAWCLKPMCGKVPTLKSHLKNCSLVAPEIRQHASTINKENSTLAPAFSHWGSLSASGTPGPSSITSTRPTTPVPVDEDQRSLKKQKASSNRRRMSGVLLDRQVVKVEARTKERIQGKLATGQCDGWKNIAKASLVSSMVTVDFEPYLVRTHNMSAERKTGENLLSRVKSDIEYAESHFGVSIIAWCTDAGSDALKMRKELTKAMPWIITIDCWAHQLNLVVGDYFKVKLSFLETAEKAIMVIKWFNNHSRAHGIFHDEQMITYHKFIALILPVITRWTCHFLSFRRLLRVSVALRACCIKKRDDLEVCGGDKRSEKIKAREVISIVASVEFWDNVTIIKIHLEPLAIAANILQASDTRLDITLLVFANVYRIFNDSSLDGTIRQQVQSSLEKRWSKPHNDQDAFIAAVVMNPFIRAKLFALGRPELTPLGLYGIVKGVFQRVFRKSPDLAFYRTFLDYLNEKEEFSQSRMHLDEIKLLYDQAGKNVNVVEIWQNLDSGVFSGRNDLVKFAIRILSIVANSAGCERLYSNYGAIHTKLRNHLSEQNVHKTSVVKMDLKRQHMQAGLLQPRKKRKFSEYDSSVAGPSSNPSNPSGESNSGMVSTAGIDEDNDEEDEPEEELSFSEIVDKLINESINYDAFSGDELSESSSDGLPSELPTQVTRTQIPLKHLFRYEGDATGLDMFWDGGIKSLDEEQAYYELKTTTMASACTDEIPTSAAVT